MQYSGKKEKKKLKGTAAPTVGLSPAHERLKNNSNV